MQVYFDSSLWGCEEGQPCDTIQMVHARFMAGGKERVIPAIYHFEEGIVFDLLTIMDESQIKAYYDKYRDWEKTVSELSEVQIQKVEQENPYQNVDIADIRLNGTKEIKQICTSGRWHIPGYQNVMEEHQLCELTEAYPEYLKEGLSFGCQRIQVYTPKAWGKKPLHAMQIRTRKQCRTEVLDLEAEVNPGEEACLSFVHPVTGERHQVFLYDTEVWNHTISGMELSYVLGTAELVPGLPPGDRLMFDSSISFTKRDKGRRTGVGTAAVIGGQAGPTAIFWAGCKEDKKPRHGGVLTSCFSRPFLSGEDAKGVFCMTGLEYMVREEEIIQIPIL